MLRLQRDDATFVRVVERLEPLVFTLFQESRAWGFSLGNGGNHCAGAEDVAARGR